MLPLHCRYLVPYWYREMSCQVPWPSNGIFLKEAHNLLDLTVSKPWLIWISCTYNSIWKNELCAYAFFIIGVCGSTTLDTAWMGGVYRATCSILNLGLLRQIKINVCISLILNSTRVHICIFVHVSISVLAPTSCEEREASEKIQNEMYLSSRIRTHNLSRRKLAS